MDNAQTYEFFAPCAQGLNGVLADELKEMRLKTRPVKTGVGFFGTASQAYRVCLFSRTASRVLLLLDRIEAPDSDALYRGAYGIPWEDHVSCGASISVHASGVNDELRNSQFTALRVKDAICDALMARCGFRPNVDKQLSDLRISVTLRNQRASIWLDLAGSPLHERGYRRRSGAVEAPMCETLAAGMLLASGWKTPRQDALRAQDVCKDGLHVAELREEARPAQEAGPNGEARPVQEARKSAGESPNMREGALAAFCDPLCGSGTLAIEAALIAADAAPGLLRDHWGFLAWKQHDAEAWAALLDEADRRKEAGIARLRAAHDEVWPDQSSQNDAGMNHSSRWRLQRQLQDTPLISASDKDEEAVWLAQANARAAGLQGCIEFQCCDVRNAGRQFAGVPLGAGKRLLAANPPYAQRIFAKSQLEALYATLGLVHRTRFQGWRVCVISPDLAVGSFMGLSLYASQPCYNGPLAAFIQHYGQPKDYETAELQLGEEAICALDAGAQQFANRLKKRSAQLRKWAKRQQVCCYRVYDADLPDFNVAIDVYEGVPLPDLGQEEPAQAALAQPQEELAQAALAQPQKHLQEKPQGELQEELQEPSLTRYAVLAEYAAPKGIDEDRAQRRLDDALALVGMVLDISTENIFFKERTRKPRFQQSAQVGGEQTAKGKDARRKGTSSKEAAFTRGWEQRQGQASVKDAERGQDGEQGRSVRIAAEENGLLFEVNLSDYLDTGLFLDHRLVRQLIGRQVAELASQGDFTPKRPLRFLNLFAYTGSATVYAATSGAGKTTSVDLSQTYLAWAQRNMELNGVLSDDDEFIRADCATWVTEARREHRLWDFAFVDPPSYSNSKKMGKRTWDVQRDHVELLIGVSRLLARGGKGIFSCNLRGFKLDSEALLRYGVRCVDITPSTIDEDFRQNQKIHHCFTFERVEAQGSSLREEACTQDRTPQGKGCPQAKGGSQRNGHMQDCGSQRNDRPQRNVLGA